MDWDNIIRYTLTAVVPAILTYFATSQNSKIKLKEIEKSYELKIKELETNNEIQKANHEHQLELIRLQSETIKDETMNNALASMMPSVLNQVLTGKIDVDKIKELSSKLNSK